MRITVSYKQWYKTWKCLFIFFSPLIVHFLHIFYYYNNKSSGLCSLGGRTHPLTHHFLAFKSVFLFILFFFGGAACPAAHNVRLPSVSKTTILYSQQFMCPHPSNVCSRVRIEYTVYITLLSSLSAISYCCFFGMRQRFVMQIWKYILHKTETTGKGEQMVHLRADLTRNALHGKHVEDKSWPQQIAPLSLSDEPENGQSWLRCASGCEFVCVCVWERENESVRGVRAGLPRAAGTAVTGVECNKQPASSQFKHMYMPCDLSRHDSQSCQLLLESSLLSVLTTAELSHRWD